MKKLVILGFTIFSNLALYAQDNVFLSRSYWKANPSIEKVQKDIQIGNNPVEFDPFMFDATAYAILDKADNKIVQYLISLDGNSIDKITHDGRNYLLWAGYAGNVELVEWLIKQGSDVNLIDEHGYGLVTFSAIGETINPKLFDVYLANGLSINEKNRVGANALLLASQNAEKFNQLSYFLEKGLDLNSIDNNGNNAFLYAARKGNVSFLEELKSKGLDYKAVNKDGENAVIMAAKGARRHHNSIDVFKYFDELNLDFNLKNNKGKNALHYAAASNKNADVIKFLIEKGIDPLAKDNEGNLPLFYAVKYNNNAAEDILSQGIKDFDITNDKGESLLNMAIQGNNDNFTKLILAKNLNLNHKTNNDESYIYQLFSNYNSRDGKDYFDKYFKVFQKENILAGKDKESGNNIFHIAAQKGDIYLLEKASEVSNDINEKNVKGLTPLQSAALVSKDVEILKTLLKLGADKSVKTEFDETVFQLASENEALKNENLEFLR